MPEARRERINRNIVVAECVKRESKIEAALELRFLNKSDFFFLGVMALYITMEQLSNVKSSALVHVGRPALAFLITLYRSKSVRHATQAAAKWTTIYGAITFTQQYLSPFLGLTTASSLGSRSCWDIIWIADVLLLLLTNLSVWLSAAYLSELWPVDWAQLLEYIEPYSSNEDLEEVSASCAPLMGLFVPSWLGLGPKTDPFIANLRKSYLLQLFKTPLQCMRAGLLVQILSFIMMSFSSSSDLATLKPASSLIGQDYPGSILNTKCTFRQAIYKMIYQIIYRERLGLRLAILVWITSLPLIVYRAQIVDSPRKRRKQIFNSTPDTTQHMAEFEEHDCAKTARFPEESAASPELEAVDSNCGLSLIVTATEWYSRATVLFVPALLHLLHSLSGHDPL
ncbi:hypothetical protein EG328_005571 [Venturia inaequalis]|uniref:Uncharacterized protein n=1 Tax=Venturia inaequalis TaxID=5025 RepID=A0A8H3YS07_VENIN|nr:hypothetical protein EG328_005571 [Venturia inaequalis]KAE9981382.1 hypothetical protein EG327_006235 [Venturia inaequalis]RDI77613.1 Nitrite reductase [NAD(P)H] [Venturia inaequalis]